MVTLQVCTCLKTLGLLIYKEAHGGTLG